MGAGAEGTQNELGGRWELASQMVGKGCSMLSLRKSLAVVWGVMRSSEDFEQDDDKL